MKVGIIVGHTPSSGGAVNKASNVSEYSFNSQLSVKVANSLHEVGLIPLVIFRDTYESLPSDVNELDVDIAISLHCNAYNGTASGCETLYHHASSKGKLLANCIQAKMVEVLGERDRGCKAIDYSHIGSQNDRGGWLVEKTAMPTIILEPFFIDNNISLANASEKIDKLGQAIAEGVLGYIGELS